MTSSTLASASASTAPAPPPSQLALADRCGLEIPGGRLQLHLFPDKAEYMAREPVYLNLEVDNPTGRDVAVLKDKASDVEVRAEWCRIAVWDERGRALALRTPPEWLGGRATLRVRTVAAHDSWRGRLFLPTWVTLKTPGRYTIEGKWSWYLHFSNPGGRQTSKPAEATLRTSVQVVAADEARMGELIASLGSAMLSVTVPGEETESLAAIEDERAVPYLVRAVESAPYSVAFRAINALGKFPTNEALEGLRKAVSLQSAEDCACSTNDVRDTAAPQLRHAAAVALSTSSHPRAAALLLSVSQDPYEAVRATVVQAAEHMSSRESLNVLRTMTADPNPLVRSEALRCLKARLAGPPAHH